MNIDSSAPDNLVTLDAQFKSTAAQLLTELKLRGESTQIPIQTDAIALAREKGLLFRISGGTLPCFWRNKLCFFLNEGDLIGLNDQINTPELTASSEYSIHTEQISRANFDSALAAAPHAQILHTKLLELNSQRQFVMMANMVKAETLLRPSISNYRQGDIIIREGESAHEVFNLLDGKAEVFSQGVKVGEIHRDEVFGMLAAISNSPRTATVKAATNCSALVVTRDKFVELIETKPLTALKIIDDMSRLIVSLNSKVVQAVVNKVTI